MKKMLLKESRSMSVVVYLWNVSQKEIRRRSWLKSSDKCFTFPMIGVRFFLSGLFSLVLSTKGKSGRFRILLRGCSGEVGASFQARWYRFFIMT